MTTTKKAGILQNDPFGEQSSHDNNKRSPGRNGSILLAAAILPTSNNISLSSKKKQWEARFHSYLSNPSANEYDQLIKQEVSQYNARFDTVTDYNPPFVDLDWRWVKAMAWNESGPNSRAWNKNPLQIGNPGDAGLGVVKNAKDHSDLVIPQNLRDALKTSKLTSQLSIRAGIAYLYFKDSKTKFLPTIFDSSAVSTYVVKKGDTLSSIAHAQKTTVDELIQENGLKKADLLHIGQQLKFKLAHGEWAISGWDDWQTAIRAYNGGGDKDYLQKVNSAYMQIITKFSK